MEDFVKEESLNRVFCETKTFMDVVNNNTKMVDKEQGWQADKVQDISGRRHHKGGGWQSCDGGQPFCGCRQGGQKHLGGQQCLGGQLHQDGRQNQGGRQHKAGQQQQQALVNSNKIILEFIFQNMQYAWDREAEARGGSCWEILNYIFIKKTVLVVGEDLVYFSLWLLL